MAALEDLVKSFKKKEIKGTYIFYGEEPFFIDYLAELLIENALEESERSFCQNIFYGRDVQMGSLRDLCMTTPMSFTANPRQLVVVREAQDCAKKMDILYKYLEKPIESTILVLVFKNTKTLDKKMPTKQATVFKSELLKEKDMPKWIQSEFKAAGYTIQADAVQTIIEYSGTNLERIHNEVQKLIISHNPEKPITSQDIQQSFGIMKDYAIYDFTTAVGEKNAKNVFKILDYYVKNEKTWPFELLVGILFPFFKTLYQIKLSQRVKMSVQDLAAEIGISSNAIWQLDKQQKFAGKYTIAQLENALTTLAEYDMRRKGMTGSTLTYREILFEMVLKIIS
ncbi:MAG: DNA polymerase III subunit delta [Chitinophagales bacterium]|nr:DNA polymerase III subunit delta [Chitinophagales bacterium]